MCVCVCVCKTAKVMRIKEVLHGYGLPILPTDTHINCTTVIPEEFTKYTHTHTHTQQSRFAEKSYS